MVVTTIEKRYIMKRQILESVLKEMKKNGKTNKKGITERG